MRLLKRNTLQITIEKPAADVFAFVINPANSPQWDERVAEGEAKDWPPQEGSILRYKNSDGKWEEYVVISFETGKAFIMKRTDGNYHVQYTFAAISPNETHVERYEWVIRGLLDAQFPQTGLDTLKGVLEHA